MNSATTRSRRPVLSWRKKLAFTAVVLAFFCLCVEIGLRLIDLGPFYPLEQTLKVEPGNRLYELDEIAGYHYLPGEYTMHFPTGLSVKATHNADGLRIASLDELSVSTHDHRPGVWIFGCSYTYGFSVNDEDTYAWRLQKALPEAKVLNFGLDGVGTIHSLMQMRHFLKERAPPKVVVLAYSEFHDMRNTQRRKYCKGMMLDKLGRPRMPCAGLDAEGKLVITWKDAAYTEWPLMRKSAIVHFAERSYNSLATFPMEDDRVTNELIRVMRKEAEASGAIFILAGIGYGESTRKTLKEFADEGVRTVDISVDKSIRENTNLPHDAHPSPKAHTYYAETLKPIIIAAIGS